MRDQDGATALSRAALQRHEEAVVQIDAAGLVTPLNELAERLLNSMSAPDRQTLSTLTLRALTEKRGLVELLDIGVGESQKHLQVTIVVVEGQASVYCFMRDLTLDYSLRRALVDSRRRFRDFVEISSEFTWEVDAKGRFVYVNPNGALGYTADELLALPPDQLLAPESLDHNPFLSHVRIEAADVWLRRRDGRVASLIVNALPLIDAVGNWCGARGVCRDVSDLREREAALVRVNNRERVLTRIVRTFRDEVNPEAMLAVAAEVLAKALGADHSQIYRRSSDREEFHLAARYGENSPPDAKDVLKLFSGGIGAAELVHNPWQILAAPARFQGNDNGVVVLWRNISRGSWSDDDRLLIADIANQIGVTIEQLVHHEHLLRISRTDALTGLLNRGAFMDALTRHVSRLRPDTGPSTLMYVDLDNFKAVNDLRGHQAGDDVLAKVRDILLQSTRPTDVVARLGGDEFAVWLVGADRGAGETRARQILERSAILKQYSGSPSRVLSLSVGLAVWQPETAEDVDKLMARADQAMYDVKRAGKGSFAVAKSIERLV